MDIGRRAKQFAPFATLRGLDETVRQQEILYEPRKILSEEKQNELDMKLNILTCDRKIQVTYFVRSQKNIYGLMISLPYFFAIVPRNNF